MAERAFPVQAVTIKRAYKNGSVFRELPETDPLFAYSEFASKLHNLMNKYLEEVQHCTDENTIYRQNAQNKQAKRKIC